MRPIYLISYPRSGSTLLRTYFSVLQGRPQLSAYPGDVVVPEVGSLTDALDDVRLVKSHHFHPVYRRIVYLIRDGRNAMISHLYLQFLHGGHDFSRPHELLAGLEQLDREGHFWGDHVAQALAHPDACFVRYEDLVAEPVTVLREVTAFAGRSVPEDALAACVRLVRASEAYRRTAWSGHRDRPEPGSMWSLLHAHRDGDYWREIFDPRARGWFHERGGTPYLVQFGYAASEEWWR